MSIIGSRKELQVIAELNTIAEELDKKGSFDLADLVDEAIAKIASKTHVDELGVTWTFVEVPEWNQKIEKWKSEEGQELQVIKGQFPTSAKNQTARTGLMGELILEDKDGDKESEAEKENSGGNMGELKKIWDGLSWNWAETYSDAIGKAVEQSKEDK